MITSLPRSTGLFYALRALRHESGTDSTALSGAEAETALVDLTIGYPGSVHYPVSGRARVQRPDRKLTRLDYDTRTKAPFSRWRRFPRLVA